MYLLAFQFGYSSDNAKDLWKLNISENQSCVGCFPRRFYGQVNLSEQYRSDKLSYFLGKSCRLSSRFPEILNFRWPSYAKLTADSRLLYRVSQKKTV